MISVIVRSWRHGRLSTRPMSPPPEVAFAAAAFSLPAGGPCGPSSRAVGKPTRSFASSLCWDCSWVGGSPRTGPTMPFTNRLRSCSLLDHTLNRARMKPGGSTDRCFANMPRRPSHPNSLRHWPRWRAAATPSHRTYWRWRWSWNPFEWYRPASSAVGMYQMTDGTFLAAKRYCIHDHAVGGGWPLARPAPCWFNSLYTRVLPSHAIELTAASLDRDIASALPTSSWAPADARQKQDLAADPSVRGRRGTGLCGQGFRLMPRQTCGDHDVGTHRPRAGTYATICQTGEGQERPGHAGEGTLIRRLGTSLVTCDRHLSSLYSSP